MSDEERIEQCQREIARLHRVCRTAETDIERYKVLLYNAISYIAETTGETVTWFEKTIGITGEELSEIGMKIVE